MNWTQVSYLYDGSLAGFLTCVFEAYTHREEPADFTPFDQACASFYAQRSVETDRAKAQRVYRSLEAKLGKTGKDWLLRGFLTCLPDRELWLWRFLRLGYKRGPGFTRDLTHPVVNQVHKAVQALSSEAHLFTGFVRFSQLEGVLVGTITPKTGCCPCCASTSAPACLRNSSCSTIRPTRKLWSTLRAVGPSCPWRTLKSARQTRRNWPTEKCGAAFTTPSPSRGATIPIAA